MYEYMHVCSLVDQLLYLAVGDQIHSLWYQKKTRVLAVRYLSSGVVDTQFNRRPGIGEDLELIFRHHTKWSQLGVGTRY